MSEETLQDRLKKLEEKKQAQAQLKSTDELTDTIKEMSDQFKEMSSSLEKLVPPGTPKPTVRHIDEAGATVKEFKDQFKEMHEDLSALADVEKKQAKEVKEKETKQQRTRTQTQAQVGGQVELGKETRKEILAALKNIRSQIVVSQKRAATATDVAAEHLASGGGLFGAAGAAASFKANKAAKTLKRKFDPLNIVNRLTGGSKLATVLAGKIMGRSEKSIRSAAGLSGGLALETEQAGSPTQFQRQDAGSPSALDAPKSITLLEKMALSLGRIESLQDKSVQFAEKQAIQLERIHDDAAEERGAFHRRPTQVASTTTSEKKDEGGSWLGNIVKMLAPVLLPLAAAVAPILAAFAGLATAAYLIYKNFDKFSLSFSLLGDSVQELYQTIASTIQSIKEWVGDTITSGYDAAIDTGKSVVNRLAGFVGMGSTPEQDREDLKGQAASGSGYAQRKLAKDVAPSSESTSILKQIAPKFADKLLSNDASPETLATVSEALRSGEYAGPAIQGLKGQAAPAGSPTRMAATGALSQMVGEAYGKIYKDAEGKPMRPFADKNSGPRLEALTRDASNYLADAIAPRATGSPTQAPGAPVTLPGQRLSSAIEVSPPSPQTGQILSQANDAQRNFAMAPVAESGSSGSTIINNVKNNNVNSTTVHQDMAPARSEESSYLRSIDRRFAPA